MDAPGALHHVVIRGIERRAIFDDDNEGTDFLEGPAGHPPCGEEGGGA